MFVFWKIWRTLFSRDTRFEIRPFALLPTKSPNSVQIRENTDQKNSVFGHFSFINFDETEKIVLMSTSFAFNAL